MGQKGNSDTIKVELYRVCRWVKEPADRELSAALEVVNTMEHEIKPTIGKTPGGRGAPEEIAPVINPVEGGIGGSGIGVGGGGIQKSEPEAAMDLGAGNMDEGGEIENNPDFMNLLTERLQAERVIIEVEERFQAVFDEIHEAICIQDVETGTIKQANRCFRELFGIGDKEMSGQSFEKLSAEYGPYNRENMHRLIKVACHGMRQFFEWQMENKAHKKFWTEINMHTAVLGSKEELMIIVRDVTERKNAEQAMRGINIELERRVHERTQELAKANEQLQKLASEDSLTGLANRRLFDHAIDVEVRRACRSHEPLSLLMCDVDYFKKYNDGLGHLEGDKCLAAVGKLLKGICFRAGDLPARYGGEEFVVVLPSTTGDQARVVATRAQAKLAALKIVHPDSKVSKYVTLSIGCAMFDMQFDTDPSILISRADSALYLSKEQGRNRFTFLDTETFTALLAQKPMELVIP